MNGASRGAVHGLRTLATGLDHPEGVALGPDGMLYAGGEAGQIYRVDAATGQVEQIADTGGSVLGLCLDAAGSVYACDMGRNAVLRIDAGSGEVDVWCEASSGERLALPNWAAFAPDGALVLSDSGSEDMAVRNGSLVRVAPGGGDGETLDLPPLHFPNGLAVDADGTVFVLESFTPRLRALRDGRLEHVCDLPGVVPDGIALDAEGACVVACYYPFRLLRVPRDGEAGVEVLVDDTTGLRLPMPTNVCFFGPELRTLAVATFGGLGLAALEAGFAGAPLHYPAP